MLKLNEPYQRENFLNFLGGFLPDFEKDIRKTDFENLGAVSNTAYLGRSKKLDLVVFELSHNVSLGARISLATDGFRIMKQSATYRALVIFFSNETGDWRLSLMTLTPERNEMGKVEVQASNPRRFSFFLGPNAKINTPNNFLVKKGKVSDFEELKSRFSLEVVNKEFYQKIAELYTKLVGGVRGEGGKNREYKGLLKLPSRQSESHTNQEFAVRLIGRIIFCWFLREKKSATGLSLIPKELLSLQSAQETKVFYHTKIEPLFFEVLNKPVNTRKEAFSTKLFSQIPYLNGGLFSPQSEDFYSFDDSEQAINDNTVRIPDSWFVELFNVLEEYNFTVDENTSIDVDLSIDPEMLGRIFENLLAEINPETGETARKNTGSYYTPRTIVEYMVGESIHQYLKEKTGISEEKLRALSSYDLSDDENFPLIDTEKQIIIEALSNVTILDPACGSGAFPIGALQKIVYMLGRVDPDASLWFQSQIKGTTPEVKRLIEKEFNHKNFNYIRKLGIIRNGIFGVDIQPIATEIARLRCFLTLVVEETVADAEPNRGIEPLPNLDFKFVTANSLIVLPKIDTAQQSMFDDYQKIEELKQARELYFNSSGIERERLKTEFVSQQKQLISELVKEHGYIGVTKADLTQKLTDWEPFSNKPTGWFDPEWMFGVDQGFDIVITNPPYDVYEGHKIGELDQIRKIDIYEKAEGGKLNAYKLFLARSLELQKENGVMCIIFQNSFLGDRSAKLLRKYILDNKQIINIDSFPERDDTNKRVFRAVKMSVCILLCANRVIKDYSFSLRAWGERNMITGKKATLESQDILKIDTTNFSIPSVNQDEFQLLKKTAKLLKLSNLGRCFQGEINLTVHQPFLHENKRGNAKVIKGAAIQKWYISNKMSQGEFVYLDEKNYLLKNRG